MKRYAIFGASGCGRGVLPLARQQLQSDLRNRCCDLVFVDDRRMVELSGLSVRDVNNPVGDIEIAITGLRPGEKLYEELLIGNNPLPTGHERIMKAHEEFLSWATLDKQLKLLDQALDAYDIPSIQALLKSLVPGYQCEAEVVDLVWNQKLKMTVT